MLGIERTRAEVYKTLLDDKCERAWQLWHLELERLNCIDRGDTDSLWYSLVCQALRARREDRYRDYLRAIERLGDCLTGEEREELEVLMFYED